MITIIVLDIQITPVLTYLLSVIPFLHMISLFVYRVNEY